MHRVHRSHSVTGTHSKRFEWMEKQWPCIRGNPRDRNESEDGFPGSDAETADGILSPILGGGESGGRGGGEVLNAEVIVNAIPCFTRFAVRAVSYDVPKSTSRLDEFSRDGEFVRTSISRIGPKKKLFIIVLFTHETDHRVNAEPTERRGFRTDRVPKINIQTLRVLYRECVTLLLCTVPKTESNTVCF